MLNLDEMHHLSVQTQAVKLVRPIYDAVRAELDRGLKNIFFGSAGGVALLTLPAARLLSERSTLPVYVERASELTATGHRSLGAGSLLVLASVSGTTREAVDVLHYAHACGARVMTLTGTPDSPLALDADVNLCNAVADDTSSESFYIQTLAIALAVMSIRSEFEGFESFEREVKRLPESLLAVKRAYEPEAEQLAAAFAGDPKLIVTGAGSSWYEAWYFGMCILEEMQWLWTRPVHASDFFHGTLELVEQGIDVLILKGEDAGREQSERVEKFIPRVGGRAVVMYSKPFELAGISDTFRPLMSPIVLATMVERLSVHIEALRDHPLTTRRYYKRLDY
jgi:fructoselysine-6-phosphate deglycase